MARRPKDPWLVLLIIHAAMMLTPIVYGVIAYAVAERDPTPAPASSGVMIGVLGGLAAVVGIASFVARALLMPARARVSDGRRIDPSIMGTPPAQAALVRLRVALIASWALCEAVAVFGLVAAFLVRDASLYAPFGAVAIALLLVHAPRPGLLIAVMTALPR